MCACALNDKINGDGDWIIEGKEHLQQIMKERFGAKQDGYDANDRPIFVAEELEYTIDGDNKIWIHDGFKDKLIGEL